MVRQASKWSPTCLEDSCPASDVITSVALAHSQMCEFSLLDLSHASRARPIILAFVTSTWAHITDNLSLTFRNVLVVLEQSIKVRVCHPS